MKLYRLVSIMLAAAFAAVGILFVAVPDGVLLFFNDISTVIGMPQSPPAGFNFYLVLAAAYMYVVTVLAFMMYRSPRNRSYPLLLVHAKSASSLLSLALFIFQSRYLIYIANCAIDGIIGGLVLFLYLKSRRDAEWASS